MKTTYIEKHDSLSLRIKDSDKNTLNLTSSRTGDTASGKGIDLPTLKLAMKKFEAVIKAGKLGEVFLSLKNLAESKNSVNDFVNCNW